MYIYAPLENVQWFIDYRDEIDWEQEGFAELEIEKYVEDLMTKENLVLHECRLRYGNTNLAAFDNFAIDGNPIQTRIASVVDRFPDDYFNQQD